ncbi:hypothetical protein P3X46_004231 [Hevea brasiliensis]|uniref:NAC domain-containing protein n=1 Tax=Hevea brasiliensis TaxID=3981 RepID=A0ABQ9MW54_HEVBR|nr:NAC domain-containing protein 90-like [Hevea brasiliensis]KAJ9184516.1 hypothetical protein P3X46_004231 [Hevea brasiliensis]
MEDLAPGFRFYPTEEELISFYLHNKLEGKRENLNQAIDRVIPVLDIYDFNPWDLPQLSGELCRKDPEQWFFFIPRQKREAQGGRPNRLTVTGYWKSTGSPGYVYSSSNNRCIGMKRTMVFYTGRIPNGRKTEWKMNEYKAIQEASSSTGPNAMLRQEFCLCRVYKTSKCRRTFDRRPTGAQIGEPSVGQVSSNEASTSQQNPELMVDKRGTSEGSFSQEHGPPSQMTLATDNEPLWDWEDLYNWYHFVEDQMHI